jgi:hypothetical protein
MPGRPVTRLNLKIEGIHFFYMQKNRRFFAYKKSDLKKLFFLEYFEVALVQFIVG